jgi:Mg2+ and Co2+ transporter CorA
MSNGVFGMIEELEQQLAEIKKQLAECEEAKTPAKLMLDQMRRIGELEKQNVMLRESLVASDNLLRTLRESGGLAVMAICRS